MYFKLFTQLFADYRAKLFSRRQFPICNKLSNSVQLISANRLSIWHMTMLSTWGGNPVPMTGFPDDNLFDLRFYSGTADPEMHLFWLCTATRAVSPIYLIPLHDEHAVGLTCMHLLRSNFPQFTRVYVSIRWPWIASIESIKWRHRKVAKIVSLRRRLRAVVIQCQSISSLFFSLRVTTL